MCRRLKPLSSSSSSHSPLPLAPLVTDLIHTDHYRGQEYEVAPGVERDIVVLVRLPPWNDNGYGKAKGKECLTTRKGKLFDIEVLLRVEVECSSLLCVASFLALKDRPNVRMGQTGKISLSSFPFGSFIHFRSAPLFMLNIRTGCDLVVILFLCRCRIHLNSNSIKRSQLQLQLHSESTTSKG